jgi:hypothetical protein
MVAEDFEEPTYLSTDEARDLEFKSALIQLVWGLLSAPMMFITMLLIFGIWPAIIAILLLLLIYVGYIFIGVKYSYG